MGLHGGAGPGNRAPIADSETALVEVIVTAQRRTQPLQDVGISVSAVSGEELQSLRIQQPLGLSTISASLSTMNATTDSTPLFLIRGIGLDDFNMNNSSGVGIYLDDVFASFPGFLTPVMFDLQRVEVLEGPQGTLYGRNTAGGAINIISKRPTDHFEGYLNVDYSRWDTTDLAAAVSGPLTDSVKARLAATVTKQGHGYQTDIDTRETYGKLNRGGVRAQFDIRLAEVASLLVNLHAMVDRSVPSSPSTPNVEGLVPIISPFRILGVLNSPSGGTRVRVGGLPLYKHESGAGAAATLDMRLGATTLASISAIDDFSARSLDNYDGYPAADNNWTKNFQQQQISEELRLSSDPGSVVDWIVGGIYSRNSYRNRDALDWTFVYGLANSITDSGKAITAAHFIQSQQSEGLYAHAETHLSPALTMITALRYSHDATSFDGVTLDPTGLLSFSANGFTGPILSNIELAALNETHSSQNVSYRFEPELHVSEKILTYASIATAYKAGIFYGQPAQVRVDWGYVKPEHVRTAELGIKSRFFSDSLQINAAVFDTAIQDRQSSLSLWAGPVGTQPLIAGMGNVPRSRIDGAEANVEWRPLAGLDVHVGSTYLHARVTKTLTDANGLALFTPVNIGQMLPDAPTFSANWLVRYQHALRRDLRLLAEANDRYGGAEHPYLADPTTFGRGHSLGARLSVQRPAARWSAGVWVTNLMDARPLTYAYAGSQGQQVSYYQKPRSVGVNISYGFE